MEKISDYNCLNDFWLDLTFFTDMILAHDNSSRLPSHLSVRKNGSMNQRMFSAKNSDETLHARLYTSFGHPSSLRVSQQIDQIHGFGATTLDLILESGSKKFDYLAVGRLVMSGFPLTKEEGLRIMDVPDIPIDRQAVIDMGIEQLFR